MDIKGIDYLGFDRALKRGTAEILENDNNVLLIFETASKAYMMACDDTDRGIQVLDRYLDKNPELMTLPNLELGDAAYERYGYHEKMVCYQAAYYGEAPALDDRLSVRPATDIDFPLIMANYDLISPEEMHDNIHRGAVFIGEHDGKPVGFIGEHTEGSIGMLFVFPEYRRSGFAESLEKYMFAKTINKGFIPFGQIVEGNDASLNLQKKLGLTISDNKIMWLW